MTMALDIGRVPFSRFGSYLVFCELRSDTPKRPAGLEDGLWLCGVHGFHAARHIMRFAPIRDGSPVPYRTEVEPACLTLRAAGGGSVEICPAEPDLFLLRCRGVGVRVILRDGPYNYVVPKGPDRWLVNTSGAFLFHTLDRRSGRARWEAPWGVAKCERISLDLEPDAAGVGEVVFRQHVGESDLPRCDLIFDAARVALAAEFQAFRAGYGPVPAEFAETAEQAAFVTWSCTVGPRGHFRRPAMLMSNNWMCNVWSWDHAFNALALAGRNPGLAWDQFMVPFDHQTEAGQLPDFVNDAVRLYNYVKPPVHGWVLNRMLARNPAGFPAAAGSEFYHNLAQWTRWWLRFRRLEDEVLPCYYHGNDSGWDNGTVFDMGVPAVGCDLAAYLVLQCELLGDLALRLGRNGEAAAWREEAERLLARLLARLWDGRRFRCLSVDGRSADASDSVFGCLPIILGKRLPASVRQALAAEIRRHLTDWGPSTENTTSALYKPDGYWRGPVWAPPTMILADGLLDAGEGALARDLALRFCRLCRASGFAENFNAVSGAPLCDPAYTWTASVFLTLANRLLAEPRP